MRSSAAICLPCPECCRDAELQSCRVNLDTDEIKDLTQEGVTAKLAQGVVWRPVALGPVRSLRGEGVTQARFASSPRAIADRVLGQLAGGFFDASLALGNVSHPKPEPEP